MFSPQTWLCELGPGSLHLQAFCKKIWEPRSNPGHIEISKKFWHWDQWGWNFNHFVLQLFCAHKVQGMYFLLWLHMKELFMYLLKKGVFSFSANMPEALLMGYELKE